MSERDASSGGMTGATGDLTPADDPTDFEPGELREATSSKHHANVTEAQARHRSEHADSPGDEEHDARIGGDEQEPEEEHF